MIARAGAGLVELLTTVALLGIVSATAALLVQSQSRLVRQSSERAASAESLRSAHALLRGELRALIASDLRGIGPDSIAMRVFRGFAIVCAKTETRVTLRYKGLREPDASKDSLLVIGEDRILAFRLAIARTERCVLRTGEQLTAIEPATKLRVGSVVLFFESGTYYLSGSALRYRRAAEGRQPITDELIDHRRSGFALDQQGGVRVRLWAKDGASALGFVRFSNR